MKNFAPWIGIVALVALSGCSKDPKMEFYGQWVGEFSTFDAPKGYSPVKGFVQLYGSDKFRLHLENSHQSWEVIGKWSMDRNRILLTGSNLECEIPDRLDQAAYNFVAINKDTLLAAYKHPVILNLSSDRKTLTGIEFTLAGAHGRYTFRRTRPEKVY